MTAPAGCDTCRTVGPACGPCSVPIAATPEPCVMPTCRERTIVRSPCGAARHFHGSATAPLREGLGTCGFRGCTLPPDHVGQLHEDADSRWSDPIPLDRPPAMTEHEWKGQAAARKAAQLGREQPILHAELLDAGLPPDRVNAAVALWNATMRGIDYTGAHRTALGVLNGTFKHRGIPDLPPVTAAELAPPGDGPVWSARSWLIRHHDEDGALDRECPICRDVVTRAGADLASFDVNGMYLSAAASDLGTGDPVRTDWPDESVLKRAGWVRVSTLEGAPWSIGERWAEGMWMPIPLVAYLRDAGAEFLMVEAVTQDRQRRWLDPHVDLMRSARAELLEAGTPESLAVLNIVKSIYTRMFGGLLESKRHNDSDTLRPWWKAAITATGQARMFRGLDKARDTRSMTPVVGLHVDAAWFVMPHGYEVPPGLQVSAQLGKFKPAGRTPWTPELAAAWGRGEPRPLWRALHESEVSA